MLKVFKKFILWFFGHIVFSFGFSFALSEDFKTETLRMYFDQFFKEFEVAYTISTFIGIALIVVGILMIIPFLKYIFSKLPFLANKTVKGTKKILRKIGDSAANAYDRNLEDEAIERLQRKHGIIKDPEPKTSKSNGADRQVYSSSDGENSYSDVREYEVRDEVNSAFLHEEDSLIYLDVTTFDVSQKYDGTFNIDLYFDYRIAYGQENHSQSDYEYSIKKLAGRIIDRVADKVGKLGCGFRIIPHID